MSEPHTMSTAIVSPRARPRPSTLAPITPERTQGRVTAPRASESVMPSANGPFHRGPRDLAEQVPGGGGDDRQDHDGEDHAHGEQPLAATRRAPEEAQHGHIGEVVGPQRGHVVREEGAQGEEAPQAEDDAGNPGQHLEAEAHGAREPRAGASPPR